VTTFNQDLTRTPEEKGQRPEARNQSVRGQTKNKKPQRHKGHKGDRLDVRSQKSRAEALDYMPVLRANNITQGWTENIDFCFYGHEEAKAPRIIQ